MGSRLMSTRRVSTGCASLDKILEGGFELGRVSLVYGEASTGKTTLALALASGFLRLEPGCRSHYVDADGKLSTSRLTQIVEGSLLERLFIWRPRSFREQGELIERLATFPGRRSQIIVDSATSLYRFEAGGFDTPFESNKSLNRQLGFLAEAARGGGFQVLLTGQVHGIPDSGSTRVEMVAERLMRYWSDLVLRVEATSLPGVRRGVVEKPLRPGNECMFRLTDHGVGEVDAEW